MRPDFSIITPTFNSQKTLADCIQSIYAQDFPPGQIQHLVIDGQSTDDTISLARSLTDERSSIQSEPDKGLYDAINKGIRQSEGNFIGILNSDDFYRSAHVLSRVHQQLQTTGAMTAFGDIEYVSKNDPTKVVRYWKCGEFRRSRMRWGWMPPHPSFFVHRSVYERLGVFRNDLTIAADYEIILRFLFRNAVTTTYVPECLVAMRLGGLSNTPANLWKKSREDMLACAINGMRPASWTVASKILRKVPQFLMRRSRHASSETRPSADAPSTS